METVCQIAFNLLSGREAEKAEKVVRQYLLEHADQVTMVLSGASSLALFRFRLLPFGSGGFIRMLRDGDIAARSDKEWTFNLTDNVKEFLNQTTLLFTGPGIFFKGFTDPKFTKNGNEIAYLVVNEKLLTLYISDTDKAWLASQGIYTDSPQV